MEYKFDPSAKYLVAVKSPNFQGYDHYDVPYEVYTYVKQLEFYINFPKESKLKELYPERFNR